MLIAPIQEIIDIFCRRILGRGRPFIFRPIPISVFSYLQNGIPIRKHDRINFNRDSLAIFHFFSVISSDIDSIAIDIRNTWSPFFKGIFHIARLGPARVLRLRDIFRLCSISVPFFA